MIGYSMELAWRGLRRFPRITLLSVLALALGMGATITARTVTRLLAGNPLPDRAGSLYAVRLDARNAAEQAAQANRTAQAGGSPTTAGAAQISDRLTWLDVQQLEAARPQVAQTAVVNTTNLQVTAGSGTDTKSDTYYAGLEVQQTFFEMFDVPLVAGYAWTRADDASAAPVAVISRKLAQKLFGTEAGAVGKGIHIDDTLFRVVGVSGDWQPHPHFYGLGDCIYACDAEQVFIPVSAGRAHQVALWRMAMGDGPCGTTGKRNAEGCRYLGFWTLLPTAAQRADYRQMLAHYADTQHAAGRFARGGMVATGLQSVSEYLDAYQVVPVSVRFGVWVAVVFLLVCMANVTGLLLTRFMRGSAELGIRRALGATRRVVFMQCLCEAGLIGLAGGLLALPLVWVGLWLVKQQPVAYAGVIGFDWPACLALLVLSVFASAAIGIVPAWRAAVIEPGLQVKEV